MTASFPKPSDTDHEDVHWALTTANSLQAQGDLAEALRWLRKAVSAAVACDDDTRAIELGRVAATIESSLSGAQTQRASIRDAMATLEDEDKTIRNVMQVYDLDQPTHVDSSRRDIADESTHAENGLPSTDRAGPFTMKAGPTPASTATPSAGPPTAPPDTPPPPARRNRAGASTLEVDEYTQVDGGATIADDRSLPPYIEPEEENTLAMRVPPNAHELSDSDSLPRAPASQTAHAMAPVPRYRVALLASADGHEPRVMVLGESMRAPPGAGVAYLIPASSRDVGLIANLLGPKKK